jgi:hypothetical protein
MIDYDRPVTYITNDPYWPNLPPKLREAKIILPLHDNDGRDRSVVHSQVTERLVTAFGGVTTQHCEGVWCDDNGDLYSDINIRYTVAVPPNTDAKICEIALWAGKELDQNSVYVTLSSGEARIIKVA